ncbi:hypothetical protein EDD21DRAFT_86050 [Dissophora ornata]|nr:hypothetical protein EDD21DRAFT_86050 [Dissophora ornata]
MRGVGVTGETGAGTAVVSVVEIAAADAPLAVAQAAAQVVVAVAAAALFVAVEAEVVTADVAEAIAEALVVVRAEAEAVVAAVAQAAQSVKSVALEVDAVGMLIRVRRERTSVLNIGRRRRMRAKMRKRKRSRQCRDAQRREGRLWTAMRNRVEEHLTT